MPTTTKSKTGRKFVEFDQFIDFQVQKTRKAIKITDLLTAGVGILSMFLGYLLVFVVLDHWFVSGGFGFVSRWLMLGMLLLLTASWVSWKILVPGLKNVNNLYAAKSIENANSELKSSLLNLVDIRRAGHKVPEEIEQAIEKRAAMSLSQMNVDEAIDRRPLMRLSYVLLAVVILGSLYIVFSPKKISASLKRALFPSAEIEVATMIEITKVSCKLGRQELPPTTEMLARSRPEIHVEIDYEGEPPESVMLYYTTVDQKFLDVPVPMKHLPNNQKHYMAVLSGEYGQGLRQNLSYRIQAGDAESGPYEITVVEPPSATVEKLDYKYPAYMELLPKSMMGGHIDVWEDTEVTVHAVANQAIHRAELVLLDSEDPASEAGRRTMKIEDGNRLSVVLQRELGYRADGTSPYFYRIEVKNKNGDTDPDPIVYGLTIRRDQKPEVRVLIPKENEKDIPENTEELSLLLEAHDPDFRVKFLTLKSEISRGNRPNNDSEPHDRIVFEGLKKEVKQSYRWKLKELNLGKGDVVRFRIEARDNKTPVGNRGYSRWITLRIVEPVSEEERKQQQEKNRDQVEEQKPGQKQKKDPNEQPKEGQDKKQDNKGSKQEKKKSKEQGDGEGKPENKQDTSKSGKQEKQGKEPGDKKKKSKEDRNRNPKKKQKSDSQTGPEKKSPGDQPSPKKKDEPQNDSQPEQNEKFKKDGSDDDKALRELVDKLNKEQKQPKTDPQTKKKEPGQKDDSDKAKKKKKDSSQKNRSGTSSDDQSDSKKPKKEGTGQGKPKKKDDDRGTPKTEQKSENNSSGQKQEQPKSDKKLKTERQKATGDETGPAEPDRQKKSKATDSKKQKKLKRKKETDPSTRKQEKKPNKVDPDNIKKRDGIKNPNQKKTTSEKKTDSSKKSNKQRTDNNLKEGTKQKAKPKSGNKSNDTKTPPNKKDAVEEPTKSKKSGKEPKSGDSPKIEPKSGTKKGKKQDLKSKNQNQKGTKQEKGQKKKGQPQPGKKTSTPKGTKKNSKEGPVQPGSGAKSSKGTHGDNQTQADPEKADLEYGKKAANLTLDKLKEQLDRGEVDENWLKKHGWSKDDLKQFIARNRKKLAGDNFRDEKMTPAQKTQFDEFLKSLKYQNRSGLRKAKNRKADNLKGVGSRIRKTPPEYREATEAFTRSLNKKKSGTDNKR